MVVRIGTSGWSYDHWHPELYPPGLPPRGRLGRYAEIFPTAELNSSFYRWPAPAAFRSWHDRLPDGFRLSVKAPRGLTHARKLYAPEAWLARIGEGWRELGDKRAMLLVQLPPAQQRDDIRLAYFLRQVPGWMRVAVEFRHPSWHCEETFALLAEHRAAYCVMSGANLPCVLRVTTDFAYVRLHGPDHDHLYAGSYPDADLSWWADRIREWSLACQDVYVYFNNDGNANAVRNARSLQALLARDPLSLSSSEVRCSRAWSHYRRRARTMITIDAMLVHARHSFDRRLQSRRYLAKCYMTAIGLTGEPVPWAVAAGR
jgi:uncharacterized protein YecE (DUF72 family)